MKQEHAELMVEAAFVAIPTLIVFKVLTLLIGA